jgi:hypothetical protein
MKIPIFPVSPLVHQRMFPESAKATIPFPSAILSKTALQNSYGSFDPPGGCEPFLIQKTKKSRPKAASTKSVN